MVDDELAQRQRIQGEIWQMYFTAKEDAIDRFEELFKRYRGDMERTSSGVWKLMFAYDGVKNIYNNITPDTLARAQSDWNKRLDNWVHDYPTSPSPHIVRATFMANYPMSVMRDRFARSTFPGGVQGLNQKLDEARQYLLANKVIAAQDPHWHALMIEIMRALGRPLDEILEVMIEGAEQHPTYYDTYFEAARAIGQLSRNPAKDMEALATTATERSGASLGNELYSRIYWVALKEVFGMGSMEKLNWNWTKMTASMETVMQRYPSQWNVQNFALFSCLMEDKEMTKAVMARVRGVPLPEVWGQNEFFEACSSWAVADVMPIPQDSETRKASNK